MTSSSPSLTAILTRQLHWWHLAALALYIFGFRYLPLLDYPDWLYQGFVFDRLAFHGEFKDCFTLHAFLPPNMASTLLIGGLNEIVSPELAGKIFLMTMLVLIYFGIEKFASLFVQSDGRTAIRFMAFLFSFSFFFLGGAVNYVFGLGLGMLVVSWLIRTELRVHPVLLSLVLLLCYCSHFLAFCCSMLILVTWIVWERRWPLLFKLFLTLIPVGLLFLHYAATRVTPPEVPYAFTTGLDFVREKVAVPIRPFAFFLGFYGLTVHTGFLKVASYLTALILWTLASLAFFRWPRAGKIRFLLIVAALLILVGMLMPLGLKDVVKPGERFIFPGLIAALIAFVALWPTARRSFCVLMAILNVGILLHVGWNTARFNTVIASNTLPPLGEAPFMWYNGFTRLDYYRAIAEKDCMPIMDSQILAPVGPPSSPVLKTPGEIKK